MFSKLSLAFILVISMQLVASRDVSTREFVEVDPQSSRSLTCVLKQREAIVSLAKALIGDTRACRNSDDSSSDSSSDSSADSSAETEELFEEVQKNYQACVLSNTAEFCENVVTEQILARRDIGAVARCGVQALRENIRDVIRLALRLARCFIF